MRRLKHTRQFLKDRLATRKNWLKGRGFSHYAVRFFEGLLTAMLVVGFFALVALVTYNVLPVKTADIKVPVATDKASYEAGDPVSGIFFGETYYTGEVRILREVFCKNYKGIIKPPAESADGNFFNTQTQPRKFDGQTIYIGNLPEDVPVGSNCVLRFTNVYIVSTPFGDRRVTYQYYTQNFAIREHDTSQQQQLDNQDQELTELNNTPPQGTITEPQSNTTINNNTTVNEAPAPTEPVTPPESCRVNILGLKLFCE